MLIYLHALILMNKISIIIYIIIIHPKEIKINLEIVNKILLHNILFINNSKLLNNESWTILLVYLIFR